MFFSRLKFPAARTFYLLSGATALFDSAMFLTLTIFYYKMVGLNPLQLVLVGTVLEGSILLFEVPTGVVADTYSRRLSVIIGMLVLGTGFIVTGLSRSFGMVILSQIICGLGYTFTSGATDAWLADEVGEEQVGAVYLRAGQVGRLTSLVGMGMNAALASVSLALPILLGGVLYVLLGLFLIVTMAETRFEPYVGEKEQAGLPAMLATFREGRRLIRGRPMLLMLMLVELIFGMSSEGFDRLGDAHLVQNFVFPSLGSLQPVVWFSILGVAGTLLSLAATELLRKRLVRISQNRTLTLRMMVVMDLLTAGCIIGFGLAGNFIVAAACLLLRGMIRSLSFPLFQAWQVQNIPSRVRATVLSITGQSNALGQVLGGPVVGWIGTAFSLRAALVTAGFLLTPVAGLFAGAARVRNTPDDPDADSEFVSVVLPAEGD